MERYRTTIILVALLVVLGGAAIALGGNKAPVTPAGVPTPAVAQYVWQMNDSVAGIDVISGTKKVSLTKDPASAVWSLTEPIKDAADPFVVSNVADLLKSLEATGTVTGSNDLVQYKLDKPEIVVTTTFSDTGHTKRTMQVGGPTFDGSGYYSKLSDQPTIYIVSNSIVEPLRSWLDTPPKFVPTATPLLPTLVSTTEVTGTQTLTGTVQPVGVATSPPATASGGAVTSSGTASVVVSTPGASPSGSSIVGTATIAPVGASSQITSTSPGAANPTTPVASPLIATATAQP